METKAIARDTGISPRKVRRVIDMVRGKRAGDALTILKFIPTPIARIVTKVVQSAVANAENNYQMSSSDLVILRAFADEARTLKRYRSRSRGRVSPILKRSSHITIIVTEKEG